MRVDWIFEGGTLLTFTLQHQFNRPNFLILTQPGKRMMNIS
jgi:hypothetical protein